MKVLLCGAPLATGKRTITAVCASWAKPISRAMIVLKLARSTIVGMSGDLYGAFP
jgi:cobalamin synthase